MCLLRGPTWRKVEDHTKNLSSDFVENAKSSTHCSNDSSVAVIPTWNKGIALLTTRRHRETDWTSAVGVHVGVARPGSTTPTRERRRFPAGKHRATCPTTNSCWFTLVFQTFAVCGLLTRFQIYPRSLKEHDSPRRLDSRKKSSTPWTEKLLLQRPRRSWRCRGGGHPPGTPC